MTKPRKEKKEIKEINLVNNNFKGADSLKTDDMSGDDTLTPTPNEHNLDLKKITPQFTQASPLDDEDNPDTNLLILSEKKKLEIKKEIEWKRHTIWRLKVMRFIIYCLNGGLTDYMMTFDRFISDMLNKCQSTNNDLSDLIFQTINLIDLYNYNVDEKQTSKDIIVSINENSRLLFNEEAMAVCIKSTFLSKYLSESISQFPKFLKLLIQNYCSNKILNSVFEFLKILDGQSGEDGMTEERREITAIIPSLIQIFSDRRKCPISLTLACKSLCLLVSREGDKRNRIKLVEEGIVPIIGYYLEHYDFDEKLILCCLDLFSSVLPETRLKIVDYLYGDNHKLLDKLRKFLEETRVPGTYYSQRVRFNFKYF